jgi:hypothetical protein
VVACSESKTIVPNEWLVTDVVQILVVSSVLDQKDSLVELVLLIVVPAEISKLDKSFMELIGVLSDSVLDLEQVAVCLSRNFSGAVGDFIFIQGRR